MTEFSTQDRDAICETFDRLLADEAHEEILRQLIQTETGFDEALWNKMAKLGLTGLMVAPEDKGIGASLVEAEALMEVAGKYLYCSPYISSCIIAPILLQACTQRSVTAPLLKKIVNGDAIFAVAGCGESGDWTAPCDIEATNIGDTWELSGAAHFVTHSLVSTHCLVFANTANVRAAFLVDIRRIDIPKKYQSTDDQTLRLTRLNFDKVSAIRLDGVGEPQIALAIQSGLIASAGEHVGAMRRIFEITIKYLNTRYQFGQPIGRFQALKHMAADLLIEVESASTVARQAARAVAARAEKHELLTYLAAFTCADNFRTVAANAIQLHGGIAYTMEHPAHLYWRRAQSAQWLFGSSDRFRDLYLTQMEANL